MSAFHFDELNALSGPVLRVFVLERPESWASARKYWRANLEPSLYRVFGTLRWLRWKPYERHRAYDIARAPDIDPGLLPCLVLLRSPGGSSRITFPIATVSTGYLRQLLGEIQRTIGSDRRPDTDFKALTPAHGGQVASRPIRSGYFPEQGTGAAAN